MVVLSLMLVMLPLLHPLVDDVLLLLVVPMVYLVVSVYLSFYCNVGLCANCLSASVVVSWKKQF